MGAMIAPLTGVSNTTEWHVASSYMETAVVEGHTSGLGFVQDASLVGILSSECVDCEWMLSCTCPRESGIEVGINDGENRTEKLFGEKGIAWLNPGDDGWCEVSTLRNSLTTVDNFSGGLLKKIVKAVEVALVDDVCVILRVVVFASKERVKVSNQIGDKAVS